MKTLETLKKVETLLTDLGNALIEDGIEGSPYDYLPSVRNEVIAAIDAIENP